MKKPEVIGATIQGSWHRKNGLPNQDAWLKWSTGSGCLVVVCDGTGSAPNARLGARMGCRALLKVFRRFLKSGIYQQNYFWGEFQKEWVESIVPHSPADCATTVLFTFYDSGKKIIFGGIGDGMIYFQESDASGIEIHQRSSHCFINETCAVGWGDWEKHTFWKELSLGEKSWRLFLCSDGIADDLIPDQRDAFACWLVNEFGKGHPAQRWRGLAKALRSWPRPGSIDDKTLVIMYQPEEEKQ